MHLLPAPIFRMTADLQARRRLGLTATLVREDGREGDVFSLIGPEALRRAVEGHRGAGLHRAGRLRRGARDAAPTSERLAYATAEPEERYRFASTTAVEDRVVERLVERHRGDQVLVIGQYLDQLDELGERLDAPVIKGETTARSASGSSTRSAGRDLAAGRVARSPTSRSTCPRPTVAIQVSGTFGSRQEEAQRLGRILRPKADGRTARFYAVTARDTVDQDFAAHRQRFLAEQGYAYRIVDADDLPSLDAS